MHDAFGRALLDHHRGDCEAPLFQRDGDDVLEHPIEEFYFGTFDDVTDGEWVESWLDGPLLDMGAGAGRDSLYFQKQFETVAIEVSDSLVTLLRERDVEDVRKADMFALREQFGDGRFESALAIGTQLGLAKSMDGLREFLHDLGHVTTPSATAVLDNYDPTVEGAEDMLGFRADATAGRDFRVMHFEYEDTTDRTLLFRLFSPNELRAATEDTPWTVSDVRHGGEGYHYRAAVTKE